MSDVPNNEMVDSKAVDHKDFKLKATFYSNFINGILPIPKIVEEIITENIILNDAVCKVMKIYIVHKDQSIHLYNYTNTPSYVYDQEKKFAINKFINSITHDFDENQIYLWFEWDNTVYYLTTERIREYIIQLAVILQKKCAANAYNTAWKGSFEDIEGHN
jgi:hypothetical protein